MFEGRDGHAGTHPIPDRADTLVAAAASILGLQRGAKRSSGVATIGRIEVWTAASNVIRSQTILSVDIPSKQATELRQLELHLEELAAEAAEQAGCNAAMRRRWHIDPIAMSAWIHTELRWAAAELGLGNGGLASAAGHDAGMLAGAGIRMGMLFDRSLNGDASHVPDEETDTAAIADAIAVLASMVSHARRRRSRLRNRNSCREELSNDGSVRK